MENNQLSEREVEILKLVSEGLSNKEVAARLFISVNTVKVHLANIFQKIGVASRTEAALFAIEKGFYAPALPLDVNLLDKEHLETPQPTEFTSERKAIRRPWLIIGIVLFSILATAFALDRISTNKNSNKTDPIITNLANSRWRKMGNLPEGMSKMAAVGYNNLIYLIGGQDSKGVRSTAYEFNPETQEWKSLTEKPTAVSEVCAVVLGGKLFVPGGTNEEGVPIAVMETYDINEDRWERLADLPYPVSRYGLAVFEGQIHLFGGWNGIKALTEVLRYDNQEDRWDKIDDMPTARINPKAVLVGDRFYVIGGSADGKRVSDNEVFKPYLDNKDPGRWSTQMSIPERLEMVGAVNVSDLLFLFASEPTGIHTIMQFVPQNNVWYQYIDTPLEKIPLDVSLATVNGQIFFFGGTNEQGQLSDQVLRYQAVYTIAIPQIIK
jgi:DNA-binding CsgD family transcriptional regulator/N-acetylneuraminic acid mutarotase